MITVAKNQRTFEKNGQPFFYLADTIWSAFTNMTADEWEYYLEKRKRQGFTVLQMNTLPQWDRGLYPCQEMPFTVKADGSYDFNALNDAYFEHCQSMCQIAVDKGFTLALVVLWANYVPGTWASQMVADHIIPFECLESLLSKMVETFDRFEPIYVISGDTDFEQEMTVKYYRYALDYLDQASPNTLKTCHIRGRYDYLPEAILKKMDFYMYQSGHNAKFPEMPYRLAKTFYENYPVKPIINSEPCYEEMGYSGKLYGRFHQTDVRMAAWQSLLSGACAGITYGAHGVWNWLKTNQPENPIVGEAFDSPLPCFEALQLPGANDYGLIRSLFALLGINELKPLHLFSEKSEKICSAYDEQKQILLVYLPSNTSLTLPQNLLGCEILTFDLQTRQMSYPQAVYDENKTVIPVHYLKQDALIIIKGVQWHA